MRSSLLWMVGLGGLLVLTARCGGATGTLGNTGDASVDGNGSSSGGGSGSSSGSASSSGSSSGAGSSSSGSNSGSSGGSSSGSSSGGGGDAGSCGVVCTLGQICCSGACVDKLDDPFNCGACGNACPGNKPTCISGVCSMPPCQGKTCSSADTCCGTECCTAGQLCCVVEGPVAQLPRCVTPSAQQPTCPAGCPVCP